MTHEDLKRHRDTLTFAAEMLKLVSNVADELTIKSARDAVDEANNALDRLAAEIKSQRVRQLANLQSDRVALRRALIDFRAAAVYEDRRKALHEIGDLFGGTRVFLESLALLCDGLLRKAKEQGSSAFRDLERLVEDVARTDNIPLSDVKSPIFQIESAKQRLKELTQP